MVIARRWTLALIVALFPLVCIAQEETLEDEPVMTFQARQDCDEKSRCEQVVLGDGMITPNTLQDFKEFMEANESVSKVYLHSPGGSLVASMQLGLMIRYLGMDTAMKSKMRCMSACAYTFMGGVERSMDDGAIIGVHRFYAEGGGATEEDGQVVVSEMGKFVAAMGVSPDILSMASRAGRNQYVAIDVNRAIDLNLDNHTPATASWQVSPSDDGLATMSAAGQSFGSDRTMAVSFGRLGKNVLVHVVIKEPGFNSQFRREQEQVAPRLLLCRHSQEGKLDPKRCVEGLVKNSWSAGGSDRYSVFFTLPAKEFKRLTEGASNDGVAVAVFGGGDKKLRAAFLNTKAAGLKSGFNSLD